MSKLSREEKKELKLKQKEKEAEAKLLDKQRNTIYKNMIEYEKKHKNEEKIAPADSFISLCHVNKIYSNRVQAVYDFSLDIQKNDFVVFVGPSGCGKSTTLRMIAGLEDITSGDLYIDGVYANDLESKDRNISMVFQSYALYPHMTVYNNMAFGLKMNHVPKEEIDERVHRVAKILEIENLLDRKPRALSGGQCQRVALGRAIVKNSKVFLMDEPLSNLDAKLRVQMRSEIVKLHNELNTTTIYVTHDQTEAMTMATKIVVLKDGYIQQIGTPKEIYNKPSNVFVATFIGSPAMNILTAEYIDGKVILQNGFEIELGINKDKIRLFYENELDLLNEELVKINEYMSTNNEDCSLQIEEINNKIMIVEEKLQSNVGRVYFGIRPEDIGQKNFKNNISNESIYFKEVVQIAELLGNEYYVHALIGTDKLIAKVNANQDIKQNDEIYLSFDLDKFHLFDMDTKKLIW